MSSEATPPAPPPTAPSSRARRLPRWLWVFTPLALGLLYAAGHALLAPEPTLANLPPPEAVLVQRFRDLDALDRVSFGPRGPQVRAAREVVAQERNVPGLPGVDHRAPVHLVLLPRGSHQDATMAIFQLEDADAFEQAFMRTDFLERGLIRHAQHLHVRGDFAAVGPSRDIVRRIGRGDLTCEDLGEDYALAADVPGLVEHVMQVAKQYPWRGLLESLGVDPGGTYFVRSAEDGITRAIIPGARRVERIRTAWDRAYLWGWMDAGRIRVDLVPAADGPVAAALAERDRLRTLHARPIDVNPLRLTLAPPHAPADAEAWLRVAKDHDRPLLAHALLACGVRFVDESVEGADLLGGLGGGVEPRELPDAHQDRGFLLWAAPGRGTGYAWTLGLAAPSGHLPPLGAFLPPLPASGSSIELPTDAAPLTKGDTATERPTPAGRLDVAAAHPWAGLEGDEPLGTLDLLTFGPSAADALEGMKNHLSIRTTPPPAPGSVWDPGPGFELLASFFVKSSRAPQVLGRALEPGGFLAALAGGHVRGAVFTDGTRLRLHLWREAP